tara:strand:- start:105152 stop:106384 length:1233 start_codon:yes stop_codon:yes gene_type:complete
MAWGRIIMAGGVAAALLVGWAASAQQVVVSGHATSLAEQQHALNDAKAQAERARTLSEELESKAKSATAEADRLNATAAALAARIQQSEADMRAGQARIIIIDRLIAAQQSRIAQQQGPLVRLTAALQSLARRPPVLALLQPGSLRDTVHARALFAQILPLIRARTAGMRQELNRSRQLRSMAGQADVALRESREKLTSQRIALRRLETQKRVAARGLASTASLEAERATALSERARDIDALMNELEAAGDIRARLASLPGPQLRPAAPGATRAPARDNPQGARDAALPYRLPVVGAIVTGLGEVSESGARSRGITVATQPGAQIVAPARGRIAFAGPYRGYGQIVILDHGGGWSSLIANMGRLSVSVGQNVSQGAPIGLAYTGNAPTITIELRRQGRPVDLLALTNARQ